MNCMRCGQPRHGNIHLCEQPPPLGYYRVVLDPTIPEICDRCEKPRSAHGGEQLFCPFYSTYRARRR